MDNIKGSTKAGVPLRGISSEESSAPLLFMVAGAEYTASPFGQSLPIEHHNGSLLATVIWVAAEQKISEEFLRNTIQLYRSQDNVFQDAFLRCVVFSLASCDAGVDIVKPRAIEYLKAHGNQYIQLVDRAAGVTCIAPGVYIFSKGALYEAYRLFKDDQGAFLTPVIQGAERKYVPLCLTGEDPGVNLVAVPSRIKQKNASGSLDGLRIAVKDNFHIKGLRTSLCNRAYFETYDPQTATASCIAMLVDHGAHLVGTTKLAAFAATEEPLECIDYQAPWNPRGDGYQSPAGSSSGSGVAVASYEWLDISIGSDTSGSGRRPAHWNGCFAVRPTHGVLDKTGFVPSFEQFDTPTFFGRNLPKCRQFAAAWYGDRLPQSRSTLPIKLIVADDYLPLISNDEQLKIINNFVADMEKSLRVKHERISFEQVWKSAPPADANGETLQNYMRDASRNSFFHDDYHNLDSFREQHKAKFKKDPYVSPPVRWQWSISRDITQTERDEAVRRLSVYKNWFAKSIMEVGRKIGLVVLPIENISPRYRDEAITRFNPVGVPMLFLSPILGGPECTVPAGEVAYESRVSNRREFLPVGISLLSAPGTDLELIDMVVSCLEHSGRPTTVLTGKTMFRH